MDVFHNKFLRRILQIQEHVSNEELLERADMKAMSKEVNLIQRRWKMTGNYYTKTGPIKTTTAA